MLRKTFKQLDSRLSNRFLGHSIGFYPELRGLKGRWRLRSSTSEIAKAIYRDGVHPVGLVFESEFLSSARNALNELERKYRIDTKVEECEIQEDDLNIYINSATTKILNSDRLFSAIDSGYLDKLRAKVREWIEVEFNFVGHMLWRNYHTNNPSLYSGDWHFDRRPTNWIRLFVLMEDVDSSQGPFHYLDRKTSVEYARKGFNRCSTDSQGAINVDSRVKSFTGKAGDGAFVDVQRLLHKAGVPSEGRTRDMVQIIIEIKQ